MSSITIYKNRAGKTRYRVHCIENGTVRRKECRTLEEGCFQLYLAESDKLANCTAEQFFALRDFTIEKMFFIYLGKRWADVKQNKTLAESSFFNYAAALKNVSADLKKMRVGKVNESIFNKLAMPKQQRVVVRAAFLMLVDLGLLRKNPCQAEKRRPEKKIQPPQDTEVQRLFDATDNPAIRMFIFLCTNLGLRTSEALAVKREDLSAGMLFIRRHVDHRGVLVEGTKSAAVSCRCLPVPDALHLMVERYCDPQADFLISKNGKAFNIHTFRSKRMRPLYQSLELDFSNHALRHFAAANWLKEGRSFAELKELLGHSSIVITMRHYGHLKGAPEKLKDYLNVGCGSQT